MSIFLTGIRPNKLQTIIYPVKFLFQVDCTWSEWNIGYCSQPCGGGTQINWRAKIVEEMFGGTCEGEHDVEEECNAQHCPGIQNMTKFCN